MSDGERVKLEVESLLARGEHRSAWVILARYLETDSGGGAYQLVERLAEQLDPMKADLKSVKVALVGTFTLEPLVPVLKELGLCSRLALSVYVGGYNAWQQELLDSESGLSRFQPDVIFGTIRAEELCPSLVHAFTALDETAIMKEIANTVESIESAVTALRRWSGAKVILHSMAVPTSPAFGIVDHLLPNGQSEAFRQLNARLLGVAEHIPGVWFLDYGRLIARVGAQRWHDHRLWSLARLPLSRTALRALAGEYVAYLRGFWGLTRKVLVLDLDNTLWGGVVGEVGASGIQLGPHYPGSAFFEFQQAALSLHHRGVLLAINSKNNENETQEILASHSGMVLRPEHFAAQRINWNDKVANMLELADELGLDLDSFVFVDDSPVECERMRTALPQVLTVCLSPEPGARADQLRLLDVFDAISYSEEDRRRGEFYQKDIARKHLRSAMASLEKFYESLEMELLIEEVTPQISARAAEMTQRTNQFNLTTRRRTRDEIEGLVASGGHEVYGLRLRDRFGDNGMIGLVIVRRVGTQLVIEDFLMSCRAIGRTVETAALAFVLQRASALGVVEVIGIFRPTAKNTPAADFYPKHGFARADETPGGMRYRLSAEAFERPYPAWFKITDPTRL